MLDIFPKYLFIIIFYIIKGLYSTFTPGVNIGEPICLSNFTIQDN